MFAACARFTFVMLAACLLMSGCRNGQSGRSQLVGAWRSKINFQTGALAGMKNFEFLYSYNAGGTMTESSNYDEASNSSPPAYGVWRQVDARTFETKYMFYTTKSAGQGDGAPNNTDWWPAGHGILTETITISDGGQAYTSKIKLSMFDNTGAAITGGGEGTGAATRIVF